MYGRGRGRGRGGGRYGRGFVPVKQDTWNVFPELENLDTANVVEKKHLAKYYAQLQNFWKSSPYYYEGNKASSITLSTDIERYSDIISEKSKTKPPLSAFMYMTHEYVPAELAKGAKRPKTSKVQWDLEKDMKKLDVFEKLEKKLGDKMEIEGSDKDEEEEEVEEEEDENNEKSEDDINGDYDQNIDFDDDEDEFNMPEEYDDGPLYDDDD